MLAGAVAGDARAAALPAGRAREGRRCARSPRSTTCPSPPSPIRRTCASSPAPGARPSWPATAACGERPGDIVDAAGDGRGPPPRRAHRFTVGQRRGLEVGGDARAALRPAHRRRRQHRHRRGRAPRWPRPGSACATRACTRRPARSTPSSCATAPRPCPARCAARRSSSPSPSTAPPRGRPRSSCAATPCWDAPQSLRDLRRDPRAVPRLLRGARPPAPAQRVARARELRPLGPAHDRGHAAAQALLPRHREAAAPAHHDVPEELPHGRHRERRHRRPGT